MIRTKAFTKNIFITKFIIKKLSESIFVDIKRMFYKLTVKLITIFSNLFFMVISLYIKLYKNN